MKCPLCGEEGYILSAVNRAEGDDSPDTETKLYRDLTYACRNKKCGNFGKSIGTAVVPLEIEKTN